jgi:hypothetical protein
MTINTKFEDITLEEHSLILKIGKVATRKILISELDKIYIKVSKLKPIEELVLIVLPFLLIYLSIQYLSLENLLFVGLSAAIPVFVKINNYKSYSLILCLKDGTVFRKKVTQITKTENISIVNTVRKKQLNHFTKMIESTDKMVFYQNRAS